MTREDAIRTLLEDYQRQRDDDERALNARIAAAEARDPELARLRRSATALAVGTMREILALSDKTARDAALNRMREGGVGYARETAARLKALGLPEDELSLRYRCSACRDTGYVGEAPSRFCTCFETRLRALLYEDGSMAGAGEQNFESFDPNRFPEANGQRADAERAREICLRYAQALPSPPRPNLMLSGNSGLGKTFLLNCIYHRAIDRGVPAMRTTAFRMFEAMRRQHVESDSGFQALLDTTLLLIDDLGTEPMMRNITIEYLFTLYNERAARHLPTVTATNLSTEDLRGRYGERVASRLLERSITIPIHLKGRDLRWLDQPRD